MGAAISRSTTPGELAALLSSLGAAYEAYAPIVVDNGISGASLLSFSSKEEIAEAIADLGISRRMHQAVIAASILEAVEANAAAPVSVFTSPSASRPFPTPSPRAAAAGGGGSSPVPSPTCAPTMVFLTHNWADGNHERVAGVNRGLQSRDVVTWFDSDRMTGNVRRTMTDGIEHTQCVMVFITRVYRDKVNGDGDGGRDNCQYEFNHAVEQLGPRRMIPVVMEAEMRNPREWKGVLGAALGTMLYVDMVGIDESSGRAFEAKMDELAALVMRIAGGGSGMASSAGGGAVAGAASAAPQASGAALKAEERLEKEAGEQHAQTARAVAPSREAVGSSETGLTHIIDAVLSIKRQHEADPQSHHGTECALLVGRVAALEPSFTALLQQPNSATAQSLGGLMAVIEEAKELIDKYSENTLFRRTERITHAAKYAQHFASLQARLSAAVGDLNLAATTHSEWEREMERGERERGEMEAAVTAAVAAEMERERAVQADKEGEEREAADIAEREREKAAQAKKEAEVRRAREAAERAARERASRVAPEGTGWRIYDAAEKGNVAALRPLVQEWSGNEDVLNWANPVDDGLTPLIIGSAKGNLAAVQLLVATPGQMQCCLYSISAFNAYTPPPPLSPSPPLLRHQSQQGG